MHSGSPLGVLGEFFETSWTVFGVAMSKQPRHFYEFGPFRLDETERLLLRDGQTVAITPKAFDMLLVLVQNSGHLLDKEELMKALWSDSFVEEANLSYNVFALRKALSEGNGKQTYIETIPKRGYRFVANVREVVDEGGDLIVEERSETRVVVEQEEQTSLAAQYPAEAEQAIQQKALTASRWERDLAAIDRYVASQSAVLSASRR